MKLKTFNKDNSTMIRTGKPTIGINTKSGIFRISPAAILRMGLKPTDKLMVHQNEDKPEEWFISKTKDENGFVTRQPASNYDRVYYFNSTLLANKIFESVKFEGKSGQIIVGIEPVKIDKVDYWPLITASLFKPVL